MADPLANLSPNDRLMAYADGELDPAGQLEAVRRIAVDPKAALAVEQSLQLRQAVSRVVAVEPRPSDELLRSVTALAFHMQAEPVAASVTSIAVNRPTTFSKWRIASGLAAAVALLIGGAMIGRSISRSPTAWVMNDPSSSGVGINATVADVVPVQYASTATQVHVRCSRGADHHNAASWPVSLASAETPVKQYISDQQRFPDLSGIGFAFAGCAPCGTSQQHGAHLLYRSIDGVDTLSLFVEPFQNQVNLPPDTCHYCKRAEIHPLLVWREGDLLFVLVGNDRKPIESAHAALKLPTVSN